MERRPIPGLAGYEADDQGRIWKVTGRQRLAFKPHPLNPHKHEHGYLNVRVFIDGRGVTKAVHTLVCSAFHGPRLAKCEARHIDGNSHNNTPGNLAWGTTKENAADRKRHRTLAIPPSRGHRRPDVTTEIVADLRKQGLSINEIRKRLNVWAGTVRQRLREAGLK